MSQTQLDIKKLNKWADSFKVIGNSLRLGLLFMLYGSEVLAENKKSLTFGQIRYILGYPNNNRANSNLSYHLGTLINAGFIEKEPLQVKKGISEIETIYHLSQKGHQFLEDFKVAQVIEKKLGKQT